MSVVTTAREYIINHSLAPGAGRLTADPVRRKRKKKQASHPVLTQFFSITTSGNENICISFATVIELIFTHKICEELCYVLPLMIPPCLV